MKVDTADRIESAWQRTKEWVTDYDGACSNGYFIDIREEGLVVGLEAIQSRHASFTLKPVWVDEKELQPEFVREVVKLLASGKAPDAQVAYETTEPGFDLSLSLFVDRVGSSRFDVDAVWWADYVFPDGVDPRQRFGDLVSYFLALHSTFGSTRLFIGSENCEDPRNPGSPWTEI